MATSWDAISELRRLASREVGTAKNSAPHRIALVYPSPYRAAMSSLGYQTIYRAINRRGDIAADRAFLPDVVTPDRTPFLTLEQERPVGDYPVIAFSVAYELELAGVIRCLELAGLPILAADRGHEHPLVIAGGPLTFSNPAPLAPFCDLLILGEADGLLPELLDLMVEHQRRDEFLAAVAGRPGCYLPERDLAPPPPLVADLACLPASSQIITPEAELSMMHLVEAVRSCSRTCAYCVMRRSPARGMRKIPAADIIATIPEHARRVGLVGAAVTDHPQLVEIVSAVVEAGREVGISSLRADRLDHQLVELLARGGYRTLTIAADGASQRLRDQVGRNITEESLLAAAELARDHKLHTLKVYLMVGLPGETTDDLDELIRFVDELCAIHPRIALAIAPFVAKRATPLADAGFAGVPAIQAKLHHLRRDLGRRVDLKPTSARWAWVEFVLAQGGFEAGLAVADAVAAGGGFSAYRRAFAARGCKLE